MRMSYDMYKLHKSLKIKLPKKQNFVVSRKKKRVPPSKGIKDQVIERSKGKCEWCRKDVIRLGLKPRFHHKDGNRSHTTLSNMMLLCNDCHDKVHEYRPKKFFDPIYGTKTRKVLIAKRIKKRGRKKKVEKKRKTKRSSPSDAEKFMRRVYGPKRKKKERSITEILGIQK